jgi:hypothetical protein
VPDPDPIERGFFREHCGRVLFFPWGLAHRGYELRGDEDRRRARRSASLLVSGTVGLGVWSGHALHEAFGQEWPGFDLLLRELLVPSLGLLLLLALYAAWAVRFTESLRPSDHRVSREQRLREAAALAAPRKLVLIGLVVGAMGGLLIWLQPGSWWLGSLGVLLGAGLVIWSSLLRRAAARAG